MGKVVPSYVLFVPRGIGAMLAFVLAGLLWLVDVKVVPYGSVSCLIH
jgi:hypothetical protein